MSRERERERLTDLLRETVVRGVQGSRDEVHSARAENLTQEFVQLRVGERARESEVGHLAGGGVDDLLLGRGEVSLLEDLWVDRGQRVPRHDDSEVVRSRESGSGGTW
jgi:hypothetical protein